MNFSRTSFKKPLLASALALAGLGIAGQANAASYSYGYAELKNFAVVFGNAGVSVDERNRQTTADASYKGVADTQGTSPIPSGQSDSPQAFAGPGPAPAQNTWSPALTTTLGARADALTQANVLIDNPRTVPVDSYSVIPNLYNVSESHVNGVGKGQENAQNIGKVYFSVNGSTTVDFDMLGKWILSASNTDLQSDSKSTATASFTIKHLVDGQYVDISGLNTYTAFNKSCSAGPGSLTPCNISSATDPLADANGYINYSTNNLWTVTGSGVAKEFLLDLSIVTTGLENSREVPEPATISLLGAGLVGMAAARRRKAKAKAEAQA